MGGVWKPPNAWFSAPAVGSKPIFFPKCWPIKAYSGVKIIIVRARPGPQLWYFLFSHRPKANGDSGCTRFLRLWSLLDFARGKGQQRGRYCHAHPPATMFRYRVIGVWKSAAPKPYALPSRELLFSSCPHGHQFVVREAVYKWWKFQSVPSGN